jgi:hypothetical protein
MKGRDGMRPQATPPGPRAGTQTLEMVVLFPAAVLAAAAMLQFGMSVSVQQAVSAAASRGAREAAHGASAEDVAQLVEALLAPHGLSTAGGVCVQLADQHGPVDTFGRKELAAHRKPPPLGPGELSVTVLVDPQATRVPDLLGSYQLRPTRDSYEATSISVQP